MADAPSIETTSLKLRDILRRTNRRRTDEICDKVKNRLLSHLEGGIKHVEDRLVEAIIRDPEIFVRYELSGHKLRGLQRKNKVTKRLRKELESEMQNESGSAIDTAIQRCIKEYNFESSDSDSDADDDAPPSNTPKDDKK
jgi:hypothetical protein